MAPYHHTHRHYSIKAAAAAAPAINIPASPLCASLLGLAVTVAEAAETPDASALVASASSEDDGFLSQRLQRSPNSLPESTNTQLVNIAKPWYKAIHGVL